MANEIPALPQGIFDPTTEVQQQQPLTGGIQFDDTPTNSISLTDEHQSVVPQGGALDRRAKTISYALGQNSPGEQSIKSSLLAGDEGRIRQQAAFDEDLRVKQIKNQMISDVATRMGGTVSPDQARVIQSLTANDVQHDPSTVLEQKMATRFVNDVVSVSRHANDPQVQPHLTEDMNVAAGVMAYTEWVKNQHANLEAQQQQEGTLTGIKNFAVGMIPFLPWWRQAHALAERPGLGALLPGTTMADNIRYMYSLPLPKFQQAYKSAMDYFDKSGNSEDKIRFSSALMAYPTSQEYLDNAMGIADYVTVGLPVVKSIAKRVVGEAVAKHPVSAAADAVSEHALTPPGPVFKERPPEPKQLDLFGEQPEQGSFRFMSQNQPPWQTLEKPPSADITPTGLYRNPKGQMQKTANRFETFGEGDNQYDLSFNKPRPEVNPQTGVFRGQGGRFGVSTERYKQGELDLGTPPQQTNFDFLFPTPKGPTTPEVAQKVQEVRQSLAQAIKATEGPKSPDPQEVLAASGNVDAAATLGAARKLLNPDDVGNAQVLRELPSIADPGSFLNDATNIDRSRRQALVTAMNNQIEKLTTQLSNLVDVSRLTPEALAIAKQKATEALSKEYGKHIQDGMLNVKYAYRPNEAHPANVGTMVMQLSRLDGTLFETPEKAALYKKEIYGLGDQEAKVVPQGNGYALEIYKHLDEHDPDVLNALVTPQNASKGGVVNMFLSSLRSAEDLLGFQQRANRQIAEHSLVGAQKAIRDYLEENVIKPLSKDSRRKLEDVLRINRDEPNPINPSERGRWYNTYGELSAAWVNRHGRPPTEAEALAYDAFRRANDLDWLVRNTTSYRDKAIRQIEQYRYSFMNNGKPSQTDWFEGKRLDKMPWELGSKADQDAGVWVHNGSTGEGKFYYKFNMPLALRQEIDDMIENRGYRVVQVFDPKTHPLQGIAKRADGEALGEQVNYVITNTWDKSPLSWNQVDYRPGGHSIYTHDWYVAQPHIQMGREGKGTYFGDNNILNVKTQAQAKMWAERIDHARQLMKFGKTEELNAYIDTMLPHSREQFMDLFQRSDSPLSVDHPVVYKQRGRDAFESVPGLKESYPKVVNANYNVHDLSNFMDKSYLLERDNVLNTVNEKTMALQPAEQLDPYVAMNRAMGQALRNVWMADYKTAAVNTWLQQFQGSMKPSETALVNHPLYFLYNPQYSPASSATRAEQVAAEASRKAIVNFIGNQTEMGKNMQALKMSLLNTVYDKIGDGKFLDFALATTADPIHFLRGIAFHTKLGLFNPVQFFVQAQTMAHSVAVAGLDNGGRGFAAAPLMRWLAHNPDMVDTVAGVASKVGWDRQQFKDMYAAFQKTGLGEIAGEAALRDDAFDPKLFRSTFGYFLDSGAMFFNEGERMNRFAGFATAYREYTKLNPGKAIGDFELGQIMRRTDDLTANMTRASNAAWQSGALSIPLQFFAYNARIMEQLLGGRLTWAEKARMTATYSAMYGLPIGVGAWVGGVFPMYDSIKKEAYKRGIDLDDGYFKPFTEGLINQVVSGLTGHDYNAATRYGPGNQTALVDALSGDKSFKDVAFGASGTIVGSFFKAMTPFLYNAASVVSDNGEYPVKSSDWMQFFRNASSFDIGAKAFMAAAYGKWVTATGTDVSKADSFDAAMAVLGLTPLEASNAFTKQKALKEIHSNQSSIIKHMQEQYRLGIQAASEGDWGAFRDYMTRAATAGKAGDMNFADQQKAYHEMTKQTQHLSDKVNWDLFKAAPMSQSQNFFNTFVKGSK